MKAVVAAFNQEKALVGAFSEITNLRMELFEALLSTAHGAQKLRDTSHSTHPEAIKLFQTLSRHKSVRLDLDEKKTFNKEMKLLSTLLQRGNSLMFTTKNVEFIDEQAVSSSDNSELNLL